MRRTALLLVAPLFAAGLLAGCDLPGGSPKVLGPDQVPNDTAGDAPVVGVPAFINGTVDANDRLDNFRLAAPRSDGPTNISITCTGDVEVYVLFGTGSGVQQDFCDGRVHTFANETPGEGPVLQVEWEGSASPVTPYLVTATYSPGSGM
jgi:hypothetical protein